MEFVSFSSPPDLEAGLAPPYALHRRASRRSPTPYSLMGSLQSTKEYRFFCGRGQLEEDDVPRHFLDNCCLCRRPLAGNGDIFMYRGDMPFCSVECRQEQIEMDEGNEKKNWKALSLTNKAAAATPPSSHKAHVRTGTVAAAG